MFQGISTERSGERTALETEVDTPCGLDSSLVLYFLLIHSLCLVLCQIHQEQTLKQGFSCKLFMKPWGAGLERGRSQAGMSFQMRSQLHSDPVWGSEVQISSTLYPCPRAKNLEFHA